MGFFPDPQYHRLAYDSDGSRLVKHDHSGNPATAPSIVSLNSETGVVGIAEYSAYYVTLIFPQAMQLQAVQMYYWGIDYLQGWDTSLDTTDGWDGSWSALTVGQSGTQGSLSYLRTWSFPVSRTAKALRFKYTQNRGSANMRWHVYGERASNTGTNLSMWHPTLDVAVPPTYFDLEDYPRSSTETRQFRVKNHSGGQTANNVIVNTTTLSALSDVTSTFSVSDDDTDYYTQLNVGNISAGATSGVLYYKRNTLDDTPLGLYWHRLMARAGSWT